MVPDAALSATLAAVRPAGLSGNESGVFWLGERASIARIRSVVIPSGAGVVESPGCWQVSADVFGSITRWAVPRRLCLLGMAHTHMPDVPVALSRTDRTHSVQVPGLLEIIIGNAGEDANHREWAWYVREERGYHQLTESELSIRVRLEFGVAVDSWRADARGVYLLDNYEEPRVQ